MSKLEWRPMYDVVYSMNLMLAVTAVGGSNSTSVVRITDLLVLLSGSSARCLGLWMCDESTVR